ncbi:FAD-dependent oxidoreductase, partial [Mesorhizobium sp. M7D.F.Ca.US.004.03.1.1]
VWSKHSPGRNLVGGSALFPLALSERLGKKILYDTQATRIQSADGSVEVDVVAGTTRSTFMARHCIVAAPAFVAAQIVKDLPSDTLHALKSIRYGAFLTAAVLTAETAPMPWERHYAISTPGRAFSTIFNQATTLREDPTNRQPGGSLMLFRGAKGAAQLMQLSDREIVERFRADLIAEFPEAASCISEIVVQRWEAGAPYSWPGRGTLQAALARPLGSIHLAGDYLEFPNMEVAARTGREAADAVRSN